MSSGEKESTYNNLYLFLSAFSLPGVIDPVDTRRVLGLALQASLVGYKQPDANMDTKFGIFRMWKVLLYVNLKSALWLDYPKPYFCINKWKY
jgi:hypothetical protein